jgi:hypothetical protein
LADKPGTYKACETPAFTPHSAGRNHSMVQKQAKKLSGAAKNSLMKKCGSEA